jgi:insulysin
MPILCDHIKGAYGSLLLLLLLGVTSQLSWAQRDDLPKSGYSPLAIFKSENDKRNYRYLILDNQLRVLLISDPASEKSAAALDIQVGANQNPADRAGLAHFLEHMLFLGTEKYPQAGEYQEFISQHGGRFNAFTAAENTNYFFEIDKDQLAPALDRFAQFFVAPLFTAEYVERERKAVHSEFMAKLKDDGRREWDVYRELMNPAHPGSAFSVGNLTTLADHEDRSVRDDMIAFYEQHYSAHLMSLVVLGTEPLNELEAMVRSGFSAIPQRDITIAAEYPARFEGLELPASLEIKPEKELRQLSFNFPIPNPDQFYRHKPYVYIAQLLGHEGRGSLLALLKRLGWAEGIHAGTGLHSRSDAVFQLEIQLTPQGVKARNQIVSLVFHAIEQLKARGVSSWRYSELQQLADLDFHYQEKRVPMETVSSLAQKMRRYEPRDIVRGDFLYADYSADLIEKSLAHLNSKNVLMVLTAPEVEPYRISKLYATPYSLRAGIPEIFELKPAVRQELFLPEKNAFIPRRLQVKAGSMLEQRAEADTKPNIIYRNNNMRVWFAQDQVFKQPRAQINLRIKSPLVAANAEGAAQAQLFAAMIADQLNEFAYPARLAGIDFSIAANGRGYDLDVFGYSARQGMLMNRIMTAMSAAQFKEDRFTLLKENLLRNWRNQNKDMPYQVLAKQIGPLQMMPAWPTTELIAALEDKNFEQFTQFANRQLIDAKVDALFYGNYFRAEALKLAVLVEHELLNRRAGRELPPAELLMLPQDSEKPWLYTHPLDHHDSIVELFIQGSSPSVEDTAHMLLTRQLLQPAFYHDLRTQKQLGYIVAAISIPLLNLESSLFIVQSPSAKEAELIRQIDLFLEAQAASLTENFAQNQQSLIKKLQEPARSLKEQGERYWNSITTYDGSFARREALAAAVANITTDSLQHYYKNVFLNKNRRLWLTSDAFDKRDKFSDILDLPAYKKQLEPLVQP